MRSNRAASNQYSELFMRECELFSKVAANLGTDDGGLLAAKAISSVADFIPNQITGFVKSPLKMLALGATVGGLGSYLGNKFLAPSPTKEEVIIRHKNRRARDLGIASAALVAGLTLPEISRMASRNIPFTNSDFSEDDIRDMMR